MSRDGYLPPGVTEKDVDESAPDYWEEPMPWKASDEQLEIEFVRRTVRQGIESMKENDMMFLKVMVSVLYHELVPE
jgi:hypothetical protein